MSRFDPVPAGASGTGVLWGGAAFLCVTAALLFAPVLFGGEALFSRDVTPFFYPMKDYLVESVRSGEIPLWNPWVVSGEPFFASLQPGLVYPGSLLLYLFPLSAAFGWLVFLHYPLAGAGMLLLLRRWGIGWPGATLGGLAFMLGGYFVSLGNFPNNLQAVAWTPWLFLTWDRVLAQGGLRDLLTFGLVCAVAFLGGEPQMLGLALILLFVHGLLRVEGRPTTAGGQTAAFVLAGLLAVALTAVQFLPFVEYMSLSVRNMPIELDYAASRSLAPRALAQLAVPPALAAGPYGFTTRYVLTDSVPWLLSIYPGVLVLLFALAGCTRPRSGRWLLFWTGAAALGLLLALGRHSVLYRAVFDWIPAVRPFRYPEKFYFLTAFALPVLAAQGADDWLGGARRGAAGSRLRTWIWVAPATGAVAYGALALGLRGGLLESACSAWLQGGLACDEPRLAAALYGRQVLLVAGLLTMLTIVYVMYGGGRLRTSVAAALTLAVAAVDLLAAGRAVNPSVERELYERRPWAATVLDSIGASGQAHRFRGSPRFAAMGSIVTVKGALELTNMYLDYQTMGPNVGAMFGYAMQDGLQGVELQSVALTNDAAIQAWADEPLRFLRVMNVRYYADATAAADSMPGLELLATNPELPIRLFEVPDPVPRAYLVPSFELARGPDEALRRVLSRDFPLGKSVVLERSPAAAPMPGATGEVLYAEYGRNEVLLRVRCDGPSLLVLSDRHYPGWRATVRGREVPVLRANGVFRAVSVPAGDSDVEFRFAPASLRAGAWISMAGVLAFLGLYSFSGREEE